MINSILNDLVAKSVALRTEISVGLAKRGGMKLLEFTHKVRMSEGPVEREDMELFVTISRLDEVTSQINAITQRQNLMPRDNSEFDELPDLEKLRMVWDGFSNFVAQNLGKLPAGFWRHIEADIYGNPADVEVEEMLGTSAMLSGLWYHTLYKTDEEQSQEPEPTEVPAKDFTDAALLAAHQRESHD